MGEENFEEETVEEPEETTEEEVIEEEVTVSVTVDEASRVAAEERMARAAKEPVVPTTSEVPAYAQGEHHARALEMLKLAEKTYGRKPTPKEIVAIKNAIHDGREPELPPPIPAKDEQMKARIAELLEENTRRDLEAKAREVGLEPTKSKYPNMTVLAEAIVDKEFEEI